MRPNCFIAPLVLIPLCSYSQVMLHTDRMTPGNNLSPRNSIEKTYANIPNALHEQQAFTRTMDYPTQIIRMSASMEGQQLTCDQVNEAIEEKIIRFITTDKFSYQTYFSCTYNPDTHYAIHFKINSYFDAINDEAVTYLQSYLNANNGSEFLGTHLNIEPAQGLVIALTFSAGTKKNPTNPPFIEYRQDRANFYFKNNYEMNKHFLTAIKNNFYSNEPEKILPFLDRWLFPHAGTVYKAVLRDANYTELRPEQIFLMKHGEPIFVSDLKYHFAHSCAKYANKRCLIQGG
ncbi:Lpg0189 family type II secretion system effector [Legionella worsleiensis]|uniref:Uncharacterized protein n=1 Tax=Legionella worsleiensis TaxID=45076 RepID=A0A0W1A3X4_9GAMM|nr:Lpg0189 family type II secretion system effector [Legionella worsleiensis]KTD75994.1 hypothetical protein Lwor_2560 [Legionella worsleiensis]STY33007.1 Uncharacterised protein [Legionella worsleiensis]